MAQGNYGTSSSPLEAVHGEQWIYTPLTSDPASDEREEGSEWFRSDLDSGDKIGTFRLQNDDAGNDIDDIPVFAEGATVDGVVKARPIQTPNGEGFIPYVQEGGEFRHYRLQHGGTWYGAHSALEKDSIPDGTVSRPQDNNTTTESQKRGIRISVGSFYSDMGATISSNTTTDPTRAYIHRVSDGQLLGETNISSLGAGDSFTVEADLTTGETYNFVVDAEGSSYTFGFNGEEGYPFTDESTDIEIVNGATGPSGTATAASAIVTVGNVGFD